MERERDEAAGEEGGDEDRDQRDRDVDAEVLAEDAIHLGQRHGDDLDAQFTAVAGHGGDGSPVHGRIRTRKIEGRVRLRLRLRERIALREHRPSGG